MLVIRIHCNVLLAMRKEVKPRIAIKFGIASWIRVCVTTDLIVGIDLLSFKNCFVHFMPSTSLLRPKLGLLHLSSFLNHVLVEICCLLKGPILNQCTIWFCDKLFQFKPEFAVSFNVLQQFKDIFNIRCAGVMADLPPTIQREKQWINANVVKPLPTLRNSK